MGCNGVLGTGGGVGGGGGGCPPHEKLEAELSFPFCCPQPQDLHVTLESRSAPRMRHWASTWMVQSCGLGFSDPPPLISALLAIAQGATKYQYADASEIIGWLAGVCNFALIVMVTSSSAGTAFIVCRRRG